VTNVTLTVDGEVLRRARVRALEQGSSVNALVRAYLANLAGEGQAAALGSFVESARRAKSGSGPRGRTWQRSDLYEGRARG
jgi:hypothetical protein